MRSEADASEREADPNEVRDHEERKKPVGIPMRPAGRANRSVNGFFRDVSPSVTGPNPAARGAEPGAERAPAVGEYDG